MNKLIPKVLIPETIFDELMEAAKSLRPHHTGSIKDSIIMCSTPSSSRCQGVFGSYWRISAWRDRAEKFMKPVKVIFT